MSEVMKSINQNFIFSEDAFGGLNRLWALRMIFRTSAHQRFFEKEQRYTLLCIMYGSKVASDINSLLPAEEYSEKECKEDLIKYKNELETKLADQLLPQILGRNLERLGEILALNSTEKLLLAFVSIANLDPILSLTATHLHPDTLVELIQMLSQILNVEENNITSALSPKGVLHRTELLQLDLSVYPLNIIQRLDLNPSGFAQVICDEDADPIGLLKEVVYQAPASKLTIQDFRHVRNDMLAVVFHLRRALDDGLTGVNIYVYGPPGTGKTEMSRLLRTLLDCNIYEVACEGEKGNYLSTKDRRKALRAAQNILPNKKSILVFDEAEDIFDTNIGMFFDNSGSGTSKAWINKTLETNRIPTIWISNQRSVMDPAYGRRFDIVIELPIPPRDVRFDLICQESSVIVSKEFITEITDNEDISPAVVARSCAVIRGILHNLQEHDINQEDILQRMMSQTLKAQGCEYAKKRGNLSRHSKFDPSIISTDMDLLSLRDSLAHHGDAKICFYGSPGTGKSQCAKWLSVELGKKIIVQKGSDLIGPYVGSTEKSIASAFQEAKDDDAILVIDEVDSFLLDRRSADRHWELTMVNEMLTQLDDFSGIFIATTNLLENLDQAALRRFDLKLKFNALTLDGVWALFMSTCQQLGLGSPEEYLRNKLANLQQLTPGDFATVTRRHSFSKIKSPDALFSALNEEHHHKKVSPLRIGFI